MGDERLIVGKSPSTDTEPIAGGQNGSSAKFSYKDFLDKECGYYLHLGMSPEEYWDGDLDAVKWYRDKNMYDRERDNFNLWLQGVYVYEALLATAPILKPFVKNPQHPHYLEEPFPITNRQRKLEDKKEKEKKVEVGLIAFTEMAKRFNESLNTKEGGEITDGSGT